MLKLTLALAVLVGVLLVDRVSAHGYMTTPATRAQIAHENGLDYCPWCSSLWDVQEGQGLDPYQGRPYPGGRPFAEPGKSAPMLGPCAGQGDSRANDYNYPNSIWGFDTVGTWAAGEVIEVSWYAGANHQGVYSYRVCQNQSIVDMFIDPNYVPTLEDYFIAEECLQEGILPCNAAGLGNTNCASSTSKSDSCNDASWGCANSPEWFGVNDREYFYTDYVRLPVDMAPSEHTLLTWRWDVKDTAQIYFSCADIEVVPGDGTEEQRTEEETEETPETVSPVVTEEPTPVVTDEVEGCSSQLVELRDMIIALQQQIAILSGQIGGN